MFFKFPPNNINKDDKFFKLNKSKQTKKKEYLLSTSLMLSMQLI